MELVTLHNSRFEGPSKLNQFLQTKYSGSYTLRKLLKNHRQALCKEPKDKVYGVVGLAADAVGFPMDYNKSHPRVWMDTMQFMNLRGLIPVSRVIELLSSYWSETILAPSNRPCNRINHNSTRSSLYKMMMILEHLF